MASKKSEWKRGEVKRKKKPVKRRKTTQKDLARARFEAQMMRDTLEDAARGIADRKLGRAIVRVHMSRDGTVDGEIRIVDIPRGAKVRSVFTAIEENAAWSKELWIGHLVAFGVRAKEEEHVIYKRRRTSGLALVSTYYAQTKGNGTARSFVTAKDVADRIADAGRKKPTEVATRLHWNPWGIQPKRRY